jgi:hypothetical protein
MRKRKGNLARDPKKLLPANLSVHSAANLANC